MKQKRITEHFVYQEYSSDTEMFQALEEYLKQGFEIKRHIYLCPVVKKDNVEYILSYLPLDFEKDIVAQIETFKNPMEVWKPDYSDTILNVLAGIRRNYGYDIKYPVNEKLFDRKYKNCIVMLLDGLGVNILENNLDENSFLRRNYSFSEHAIYPSTTAASTTSTVCGLTPLESGWTGWSNWIREMNREIILFNGMNYYTEEPTGRSGYQLMPYQPFFKDMKIDGYVINPDFSKEEKNISDVLHKSLEYLSNGKPQIQYVYFTEPDALMHEFGPYDSRVKEALKEIDKKVEDYASKLPSDTLLVISADHGHTAVKDISFATCRVLIDMLRTLPSNDSRCTVFRVKEGKHKEFENLFQNLFGDIYRLLPTEVAIKEGYFGDPNGCIHERIPDFLGDYVAMGIESWYFNLHEKKDFIFKSHHAGITREEMEVPVIVVRR